MNLLKSHELEQNVNLDMYDFKKIIVFIAFKFSYGIIIVTVPAAPLIQAYHGRPFLF
ncbi:MAG: hypothetical protein PHG08_07515 [Bacilli bacterium]|jgi:hypothetical protein|nr:hypothetical protein [Bacilli bacterium]